MGILDDFIKNIKGQREQYKAEQEKAAKEKEAAAKKERQGKPSDYGFVGEVAERMKQQRKEFEEAEKKGAPQGKGPMKSVQVEKTAPVVQGQRMAPAAPLEVEKFGHRFQHSFDYPPNVWLNEGEHTAYISDIDAFLKSGGKIVKRDITSAMDPYIYKVFTPHGGPEAGVAYYKPENILVSLTEDPFAKYRPKDKNQGERYKYKVVAAYQRMTGKQVYGNEYFTTILPDLEKKGMTTDDLISKYGQPGD